MATSQKFQSADHKATEPRHPSLDRALEQIRNSLSCDEYHRIGSTMRKSRSEADAATPDLPSASWVVGMDPRRTSAPKAIQHINV